MAFKATFLLNNERIQVLARHALATMSAEERAAAEIPVLGASEDEIHALKSDAQQGAEEHRQVFGEIKTYCMFIGYPRSGHSLVGSLLDAHEHAVIAHELNALKFLDVTDFSAGELYWLLLENSRRFANMERLWGDYTYVIPGQHQGSFSELKVIGDKKGAGTTQMLAKDPQLLDRLKTLVNLPLRVLHITRNPFDNIATVARKDTGGNIRRAANFYFSLCRTNRDTTARLEAGEILHLRHEDFIADPRAILTRCCEFLGIDAGSDYLDASTSLVSGKPSRPRDRVQWSKTMRTGIEREIDNYDFLKSYSFDDQGP